MQLRADMSELADEEDLKSFAERRAGSSPAVGTIKITLGGDVYAL